MGVVEGTGSPVILSFTGMRTYDSSFVSRFMTGLVARVKVLGFGRSIGVMGVGGAISRLYRQSIFVEVRRD